MFFNASGQWGVAGLRVTFLHMVIEKPGFFPLVVLLSLKTSNHIAAIEKGEVYGIL